MTRENENGQEKNESVKRNTRKNWTTTEGKGNNRRKTKRRTGSISCWKWGIKKTRGS